MITTFERQLCYVSLIAQRIPHVIVHMDTVLYTVLQRIFILTFFNVEYGVLHFSFVFVFRQSFLQRRAGLLMSSS